MNIKYFQDTEKEHRKCDDPRVAVGAGGFVGVRTRVRV